jgi:hypothetical protein
VKTAVSCPRGRPPKFSDGKLQSSAGKLKSSMGEKKTVFLFQQIFGRKKKTKNSFFFPAEDFVFCHP